MNKIAPDTSRLEPEQDLCSGCMRKHDLDDLRDGFCLKCEEIGRAWSSNQDPAVQPAAGREEIARVQGYVDQAAELGQGAIMVAASDLRAILAAISTPAQASETGGEAWDWLASDKMLELSFGYGPELDDDGEWRVHERSGNINDREWTLIASGNTPLEAVQKARAALTAPKAAPGEGEQS